MHVCVMLVVAVVLVVGHCWCGFPFIQLLKAIFVLVDHKIVYSWLHTLAFSLLCPLSLSLSLARSLARSLTHTHTLIEV